VVFDKQARILEIDMLIDHFKKWEEIPKENDNNSI